MRCMSSRAMRESWRRHEGLRWRVTDRGPAGWLFALVGPWFYDAAAFAGGLLLGVWLDWVLREADGSRAARVRQVGLRLSNLGHYLEAQLGVHGSLPTSSYDVAPEIVSALIRAERLRVWVPTLELGGPEMVNYLRSIGMLLADGHLAQARAAAKDIRAGITSR